MTFNPDDFIEPATIAQWLYEEGLTYSDPRNVAWNQAAGKTIMALHDALRALYAATPDNEGGELGIACMNARRALGMNGGGI